MIRFDTFRFGYDTKKVIVLSRSVPMLWVRYALLLTKRYLRRLGNGAVSAHESTKAK